MYPSPSSLARPEHTGENRCWPCTVVNLLLLAIGCLALAFVSPVASLVAAPAGVAVIWLRGYLVPGTPRFAPRLVAALPVDGFHADGIEGHGPGPAHSEERARNPGTDDGTRDSGTDGETRGPGAGGEPGTLADATTADGEAILESLVAAGVVEATDEELRLDDEFRTRWRAEMEHLANGSPANLASAALDEAPAAADTRAVQPRDRTYVVLSDGSGEPAGESWLHRPVAVAETAAARALADAGIDAGRRPIAARGLATFLEACPVCGDALVERPAGGCCGPPQTDAEGRPLQALVCEDCRAQFAAFD